MAVGLLLMMAGVASADDVATEIHQARQWMHMGEMAQQFHAYDLAIQIYQRVMERYPGTWWAKTAEEGIAQVKLDAGPYTLEWDSHLAGTAAGLQAQQALYAGDLAYRLEDPEIALRFYERAQQAAPDSLYSRRAASKIRWVRHRTHLGP